MSVPEGTTTFEDAGQAYSLVRARLDAGEIDEQTFLASLDSLRVVDESGGWWQLDRDGNWLSWDGAEWRPYLASAEPSGQPPTAGLSGAASPTGSEQVQMIEGFISVARQIATQGPEPVVRRGLMGFLSGRSQGWWNVLSVAGGAASGGLWYWYSTLRGASEGVDTHTPLIMIGLSVGLVLLRRPIDMLLAPLQSIRRKIPGLALVGAGLATPLLVAQRLYGGTFMGERMIEYPYLHACVVMGTLLSYVILRTPERSGGPSQPASRGER
jgi:hypothetical protein